MTYYLQTLTHPMIAVADFSQHQNCGMWFLTQYLLPTTGTSGILVLAAHPSTHLSSSGMSCVVFKLYR